MHKNIITYSSVRVWQDKTDDFLFQFQILTKHSCTCSSILLIISNKKSKEKNNISSTTTTVHLYINLACLFVCLYQINVKTAEPMGPNFLCDLAWPQGGFIDDQIYKNLPLSKFGFGKFWKSTNFFWWNPRNFLFLLTQRTTMLLINKENPHVIY